MGITHDDEDDEQPNIRVNCVTKGLNLFFFFDFLLEFRFLLSRKKNFFLGLFSFFFLLIQQFDCCN